MAISFLLCSYRSDSSLYFETINLNTQANWYTDKPDGKDLPILSLQQLEKDTFFVGLEHKAMFVDRQGKLKPNTVQASELNFDKPSERMGECAAHEYSCLIVYGTCQTLVSLCHWLVFCYSAPLQLHTEFSQTWNAGKVPDHPAGDSWGSRWYQGLPLTRITWVSYCPLYISSTCVHSYKNCRPLVCVLNSKLRKKESSVCVWWSMFFLFAQDNYYRDSTSFWPQCPVKYLHSCVRRHSVQLNHIIPFLWHFSIIIIIIISLYTVLSNTPVIYCVAYWVYTLHSILYSSFNCTMHVW